MIKNICLLSLLLFLFCSCNNGKKEIKVHLPDWDSKTVSLSTVESLTPRITYLPIYSHIYQKHENRTFDLTITVSIRNISISDTAYIHCADYYNTKGCRIREYLKHPIYVAPLETIELVIAEGDKEGGSGANFLFKWSMRNDKNPPLFEAVMISTYQKQGVSFTTRGINVVE